MKRTIAVAALLLGGCASAPPLPADAGASFDPILFFSGRTHGDGLLHKTIGGSSVITVESTGRIDERGTLILDQIIREADKLPRLRRWVLRRAGPNRYTGTLTDAAGPVEIAVAGPRATIGYRMKNGLGVQQRLALQPGGQTLFNRLTITRFGLRLAQLDETIRKLD